MGWVTEIAKALGYAVLMGLIYLFVSLMPAMRNSKAMGWVVLRIQGYPLMLIGFFLIVMGFTLTRTDLVSGPDGRPRFTLR
jgi:hypothetical protein